MILRCPFPRGGGGGQVSMSHTERSHELVHELVSIRRGEFSRSAVPGHTSEPRPRQTKIRIAHSLCQHVLVLRIQGKL